MRHVQIPRPVRIAFANGHDPVFAEAVKGGLAAQARLGSRWILHSVATGSPEAMASDLARWRPDGVVLYRCTPECRKVVRDLGLVAVEVGDQKGWDGTTPWVVLDHQEAGRRGAAFFLERGYSSLAFFSDRRMGESENIGRGFAEAVGTRKVSVATLDISDIVQARSGKGYAALDEAITEWLEALPSPTGMVLASDRFGLWVSELCHQAGRRIPFDISLLGVGNHAILCEGVWPPLSSVDLSTRELGVRAAAELARRLDGNTGGPILTMIPAGQIVERASTDSMGVRHPRVALAMEHILAHSHRPLTVERLARAVGVGSRTLEREFRVHLDQTPLEAIQNHRLERARNLLETTALSIEEIAERVGFAHASHLSSRFKATTGFAPGRYRRQVRG